MPKGLNRAALTAVGLVAFAGAASADELVMYCSVQQSWCEATAAAFTADTGVDVAMQRKDTGAALAQIRAEASNPQADVWWGGSGDAHIQAASEDLTEAYESPNIDQLQDWAIEQYETADHKTVGIYSGVLGWGYNTEFFDRMGLKPPLAWSDLENPDYEGEIQVANPNTSGTAYTALATLVQLYGEDEAFEFLKRIDDNISEYTQSGTAGIRAAALGETGIGIAFLHDVIQQAAAGFPVKAVAPSDGTGYEIGSMSIIANAPDPELAKQFYDWALTAKAQSRALEAGAYQIQANKAVAPPPEAPKLEDTKLIDYDFAKYGSAETRSHLLKRWDDEIGSQR
ncbi:ABC transporter substrate-binding protein [Acuticoccus mangrovi]|uniref:ABC transporter substrate-binding protein n=1 Tax=Acuticoccus mangrovi TaxID=2796142 RepID=A0A934MEF4_9HYPH|nr:ABC transporter substrate-binding protein [Acuticoccus mangrovi]MBJ3774313.1 ABC transporter substrate-binding protein [Acuticoccus mangrovi]